MTIKRVVFANGALWWKGEQTGLVSWGRTRKQAKINFRREHPVWLAAEVLRRMRDGARNVGEGLRVVVTAVDNTTVAFERLGEVMSR